VGRRPVPCDSTRSIGGQLGEAMQYFFLAQPVPCVSSEPGFSVVGIKQPSSSDLYCWSLDKRQANMHILARPW
jgi:hypothetical protein